MPTRLKPSSRFERAVLLGFPGLGLIVALLAFRFFGVERTLWEQAPALLVYLMALEGLALGVIQVRRHIQRQAFVRLAALLGISLSPGRTGDFKRLEGQVTRGTVCIEPMSEGLILGTRVTLEYSSPSHLELFQGGEQAGARALETGDGRLDAVLWTSQPPGALEHALLDAAARDALVGLLDAHPSALRITPDRLELTLPEVDPPPYQLKKVIQHAQALHARLALELDVPKALAQNAQKDPNPQVRLKNLEVLYTLDPTHALMVEALHSALKDPDWALRLWAAHKVGRSAVSSLRQVVLKAPDPWPARAVTLLGELGGEGVVEILGEALEEPSTQAAAAAALEKLATKESIPGLVALFRRTSSLDLKRQCVRALGRIGDASANPLLLEALAQAQTPEVQREVIEALARTGDRLCVMPLYHLGQTGPKDVRLAAQAAMLEIQSRLGPVEEGWLSLADQNPLEGAVSLTETSSAGAVSLVESQAKELPVKQSLGTPKLERN